ncbi:MAG: hypothetical protein Q8Q12_12855 [bacterium]|nr:hypothetical protein [bacterium]
MNAKASATCVLVVSFLFLFCRCGLCTYPELIYPPGGETFTAGETAVGIEWKNQPAGTATIEIRYDWWGEGHSTHYMATIVEGLAAGTTTYAWHIPCEIDGRIVSGDYGTYGAATTEGKIQVRFLESGGALVGACNNSVLFTVLECPPVHPELIYPAGGETFTAGESRVDIEWKDEPPGTATIDIRYDWWGQGHSTHYMATLVEGLAAGTTTHAWDIPCDIDGTIVSEDYGTYPTGTAEGKIQVRFLDTGKALLDACNNGIFFTVTPCGPFALVKPEDGAEVLSPRPTLAWSGGTAPYSAKVGLDSNFVNVLWEKTEINDKTVEVPTDLPSHTTLWCHVSDSSDPNVADSNRFIRRGPPTLTGPADGATLPEGPVTFEWQPLGKVDVYTVQIATDPGFSNIIGGGSGVETQNTLPMPTGTYYWHVHASTKSGDVSEWSAMRTVHVGSEQEARVIIYPAQSYDPDSRLLSLWAILQDTLKGPVTEATLTWSLTDLGGAERARGTLSYSGGMEQWTGSKTFDVPGLVRGEYEVVYSVLTVEGRHATTRSALFVDSLFQTVSGQIKDSLTGSALSGVQVALFESGPFWTLVNDEFNGIVPAFATLLSRLTPARGPATTGEDGGFGWPDVPPGGSYVIVAANAAYIQNYTYPSFDVPGSARMITKNLSLSPETPKSLLTLLGDVDELLNACDGVLDYNAQIMADMITKVKADNLYGDPDLLSFYSFVSSWIAVLNPGSGVASLSNAIGGISMNTLNRAISAEALLKAVGRLVQLYGQALTNRIKNDIINQTFPLDQAGFRASEYDTVFSDSMAEVRNVFRERATSIQLDDQLDLEKARHVIKESTDAMNEVSRGSTVFLVSPSPGDGIGMLKLKTMTRQYDELSNWQALAAGTEAVLSTVQVAGTAITIGSAITGVGAPVAGVAAAATTASGFGKYIIQQARVVLKAQMAYVFTNSLVGTYPEDNGLALEEFYDVTDFLIDEAESPYYVKNGSIFESTTEVNLNLPEFLGLPYMFTLGFPGLDVARAEATATIHNRGNVPAEFRVTAYGIWSPIDVFGPLGLGAKDILTSGCMRGPAQVLPSAGMSMDLAYQGYSRNFLSQFKPHYLTVDTYSGPWRMAPVTKQYWVFGLGELVFPSFPLAKAEHPGASAEDCVMATGFVTKTKLTLHELRELTVGTQELVSAFLSASTPKITVEFSTEDNLFAADLRLFAPQDDSMSILVIDAAGRRLGYSAAEGIRYNELLGSVTNMSQRPISIRLFDPPGGETFRVELALLSPGPRDVGVTLFYEPVKRSTAVMTAFPSLAILDGDQGSTQSLLLRLGEASGQEALTSVIATLGEIQLWDGSTVLPIAGDRAKVIGDLPAGDQQYVSWDISYPGEVKRGKYVGMLTVSSKETADLAVPVVCLIRATTETVSLYQGPDSTTATLQKTLALGPDGTAQTWVHVPSGFRVLYAAMGVVGASDNLESPSLDIGADGSIEWAFSGKFDLGVLVSNINVENAFNAYLDANSPGPDGWNVPMEVKANPGESVLLNGVQLYLERLLPALSISSTVEGFELTIDPAESEKTYVVKFANSMNEPWSVAATLQGQGGEISWVDNGSLTGSPPSAVKHRFYVIEVR